MKSSSLILEYDLEKEASILLKNHLRIHFYALCLSLAQISKILFSTFLETTVVS